MSNITEKQRDNILKKKGNMMSQTYKILPYTIQKAKKLNVSVKPSTRKGKKIDVYDKEGKYVVSVGALGYSDYPTYMELEKEGISKNGHALKRRKLYRARHAKDIGVIGSGGYYANELLW